MVDHDSGAAFFQNRYCDIIASVCQARGVVSANTRLDILPLAPCIISHLPRSQKRL